MERITGAGDERVNDYSLFSDLSEVLRRARLGVREALRDNQLAQNPVVTWRDGEVVVAMVEGGDGDRFVSVTPSADRETCAARKKRQ